MKPRGLLLLAGLALLPAQTTFSQDDGLKKKEFIQLSGDPDSFGSNMKFMGVVGTPYVVLDPTCDRIALELGPDDRCVVLLPGTAQTTFDVRDLAHITLPEGSTKDIWFFMATHIYDYQLQNSTGVWQSSAFFRYGPYLTIESAALNDPRAVDPITGNPLNGKMDGEGGSTTLVDRSLAVDERIREHANYSRVGINSLSKQWWRDFGLPEDLIKKLFSGPVTLRLNVKGRAKLVSDANMLFAIRWFGN